MRDAEHRDVRATLNSARVHVRARTAEVARGTRRGPAANVASAAARAQPTRAPAIRTQSRSISSRTRRAVEMNAGLAAIYESLQAGAAGGVDGVALRRETGNLRPGVGGAHATALQFSDPPGSCRLVVAPVRLSPVLDGAVRRCREQALSTLASVKPGSLFVTPTRQLHVTLFHTGRTGDPRLLSPAAMAEEEAQVRALVAATPRFTLTVDRLLLSNTGVFLLLFQSTCQTPWHFRERMRAAFPGSPAKQSVILHSSLFRLMEEPLLEEVVRLRELCEGWTRELHGQELSCSALWYILETALPIDGEVKEMAMAE